MTSTALKRAARRQIDRQGQDVTLTNYENAGDTEYGEEWQETTDSPKTIAAIPDRTGEGLGHDRDERSADSKSVRTFHVKDTVTGLRDGGGSGASRIDDGGTAWTVMQLDDLDNGQYRLLCWRDN